MNILITICARGNSKGVPEKNIKPLNGKPLLHYTFEAARRFANDFGGDIQLSTDSPRIIQSAKDIGYETKYVRPDELALDSSGKIDAIRDAWIFAEDQNAKAYDYVLDLDVSSPLRSIEDLKEAFGMIRNRPDALDLFSVNRANRNPYFNMVERNENGYVQIVKDGGQIDSRQTAPEVFDMNASFYFFSRKFMISDLKSSITPSSLIYIMPHICFDIDHQIDFTLMELLIKEKKLDFEL